MIDLSPWCPVRALAVGALILAAAGPAAAHSLLLESSPGADALVQAPPASVTLRFNNRIEKKLSSVRLRDAAGRVVVLPVDADGPADRLNAAATPIAPGKYRVEWQVLSTDGHVASGSFSFRLPP